MNRERYQRMMELFEQARGLSGRERAALLRGHDEEDAELIRKVEAMLRQDASPTGALGAAGAGMHMLAQEIVREAEPVNRMAKVIGLPPMPMLSGQYRIIRTLGEGGMGVVYEAEQAFPRRTVALKAIRPGLESQQLLRRFEHEAHLLGRLHHPGIAALYEAGAADEDLTNQAFIAMELVRGEPLTTYAQQHNLGIRQRVELVVRICEAVQHAHQRGVIHRDLKPSNILVDAEGRPKVLDFGVARAIGPDPHLTTMHTISGQVVGTLAYMSPEQVSGNPGDVDTRSDIYAIGVLLHELLAGSPPHDVASLSLPEAARVIRERDPEPLGERKPELRGDLETIVAKALEKDPSRRYQSASELASDLERFLSDRPILARPATAMYQVRKFARRHRGIVLAGAAVGSALVLGVSGTIWQAVKATQARGIAERASLAAAAEARAAEAEAGRAARINQFLTIMLSAPSPVRGGKDLTVREMLDHAAACVDTEMSDRPDVAAELHDTIGETYRQLGVFDLATQEIREGLELRRAISASSAEIAKSIASLATLLSARGDYINAEPLARESLAMRRQILGDVHPDVAYSLGELGIILYRNGKEDEAEAMFREALDVRRKLPATAGPELAMALSNLGTLLAGRGDPNGAEPLLLQALELNRKAHGPSHPSVAVVQSNYALVLRSLGRLDEAERLLHESEQMQRRLLGDGNPALARSLSGLAAVARDRHDPIEAVRLSREALAIQRRSLTSPSVVIAETLESLGLGLLDDLAEPDHVQLASQAFQECVQMRESLLPAGHPVLARARSEWGGCLLARDQAAEAEPLLVQGWEVLGDLPNRAADRAAAGLRLIDLYEKTGRRDDAARIRSQLQAAGPNAEPQIRN